MFGLAEVPPERIQPRFPEAAMLVQPARRGLQRAWHEHHPVRATLDASSQEARGLEHAQVLRDSGQRHVERFRQLSHGGRRPRQPFEDRATRRIREGRKGRVQRGRLFVNHLVKLLGSHVKVKRGVFARRQGDEGEQLGGTCKLETR